MLFRLVAALGFASTALIAHSALAATVSAGSFTADSGFVVSGKFAEGEVITVNGNGFGTKANGARAAYIWDFDKSSDTSPDSRIAVTGNWNTNVRWDSLIAPTNATKALRYVLDPGSDTGTPAGVGGATNNKAIKITPPDLYVWSTVRMNFNGIEATSARKTLYSLYGSLTDGLANWNLKGWRIWYNLGQSNANDWVLGYADGLIDGNPRATFERAGVGYDLEFCYNPVDTAFSMPYDKWQTQEVVLHQSSGAGVADAFWAFGVNGKLKGRTKDVSRTSSSPGYLTDFYFYQAERTGWKVSDNKYVAYGFVYVDDSLARAVITDQATWNTGTTRAVEVQIPLAWSNSQVQLRVRGGQLASFAGKYLWVVTPGNTPIRVGQFGGGEKLPMSPEQVTAQ